MASAASLDASLLTGLYLISSSILTTVTEAHIISHQLKVRLLAPGLIEFQGHEGVTADFSSKSLAAPSAKCWLAEPGLEICPKCEGDWSRPQDDLAEILNGRWETAPNSRFGRKAPYLEKLKVIGGFVNQAGGQYVAKHKVNRAQEIYDVGWS